MRFCYFLEKCPRVYGYVMFGAMILFTGCSSKREGLDKKNADALYNSACSMMQAGDYAEAASNFKEIDDLFPYSSKACFGQVLSAYCHFRSSNYIEALGALEIFLRYHPSHDLVPYAMYLRAMCIYMRVSSVGRDSKAASEAKLAFVELLNKFPNSRYREDCLKRIFILDDIIAAHEMSIGRFYQKNGNALSAIGRYNFVIVHLGHTKHCPEAYYRMMECCRSEGLFNEAAGANETLKSNFPNSEWCRKGQALMSNKR